MNIPEITITTNIEHVHKMLANYTQLEVVLTAFPTR